MRSLKKIVSLILVLVILLFVSACRKDPYISDVSNIVSDYSSEVENLSSVVEETVVSSEVPVESVNSSVTVPATVTPAPSVPQTPSTPASTVPVSNNNNGRNALNYDNVKGIWLYQYASTSLFRKNSTQRDESEYKNLVTKICQNLQMDGFNTLYLQVRGHGDSFYPSELFPPTQYVVKDYNSKFSYDPLSIFVDIAHKHNISIHAWINPYRLLRTNQIASVPDNYKIKQWYLNNNGDYIVAIQDRYYANPAYKEVQNLIIDGAVEICKNYEVDGIHIDDYFYHQEANETFDAIAYQNYGNGRTLQQFRRDNISDLVRGLYSAVHAVNPTLQFGVSPNGNMSHNRGYISADIDKWCTTEGYIDYIAPQIYWSHDYVKDYAKFDICTTDWGNLVTCSSVKLIIGIGLYRTETALTLNSLDPGWYEKKDNIKRQIEFVNGHEKSSGFIMFDYESLYDIYTGEYTETSLLERNNFLPLLK